MTSASEGRADETSRSDDGIGGGPTSPNDVTDVAGLGGTKDAAPDRVRSLEAATRFAEAVYRGEVRERSIVGTVTWRLPPGQTSVVTPTEGITFRDFAGSGVRGGFDADGRLRVVAAAGAETVTASWAAPLTGSRPERRFDVRLPAAATSRVVIEGWLGDVFVTKPGPVIGRSTADATEVVCGPRSVVGLTLADRTGVTSEPTLTVGGTINTVISDVGVTHAAVLKVAACGGPVDELRIPVGPGWEVGDVRWGGYEVRRRDERDVVVLVAPEPLDETPTTVELEVTSATNVASRHEIWIPVPREALPSGLQYSVAVRDGLELKELSYEGLRPVTADRFEGVGVGLTFAVDRVDAMLTVAVGDRDAGLRVETEHRLAARGHGSLCESVFVVSSEAGQRFGLTVAVPAGWETIAARLRDDVDGLWRPLTSTGSTSGTLPGRLRLSLPEAIRPGRPVTVSVLLRAPGPRPPIAFPSLPEADPVPVSPGPVADLPSSGVLEGIPLAFSGFVAGGGDVLARWADAGGPGSSPVTGPTSEKSVERTPASVVFLPHMTELRSRLGPRPAGDTHEAEFDWRPPRPSATGTVALAVESLPYAASIRLDGGDVEAVEVTDGVLTLPDRGGRVRLSYRGGGTAGRLATSHRFPRVFAADRRVLFRHTVETNAAAEPQVRIAFGGPPIRTLTRGTALRTWCLLAAVASAAAALTVGRFAAKAVTAASAVTVVVSVFAAVTYMLADLDAAIGVTLTTLVAYAATATMSAIGTTGRRRNRIRTRTPSAPSTVVTTGRLAAFAAMIVGGEFATPPADADEPERRRGVTRSDVLVERVRFDLRPLSASAYVVETRVKPAGIDGAPPRSSVTLPFEGLVLRPEVAATWGGRPASVATSPTGFVIEVADGSPVAAAGEIVLPMAVAGRASSDAATHVVRFRGPAAASTAVDVSALSGPFRFGPGAVVPDRGDLTADRPRALFWTADRPIEIEVGIAPTPGSGAGIAEIACDVSVSPTHAVGRYEVRRRDVDGAASPWKATWGVPAGAVLLSSPGVEGGEVRVAAAGDGSPVRVDVSADGTAETVSFTLAWPLDPGETKSVSDVIVAVEGPSARRVSLRPGSGFAFAGSVTTAAAPVGDSSELSDSAPRYEVTDDFFATVRLVPRGEAISAAIRQDVGFIADEARIEWSCRVRAADDRGDPPLVTRWTLPTDVRLGTVDARRDGASRLVDAWAEAGVLTVITTDRSAETELTVTATRPDPFTRSAGAEPFPVPLLTPVAGEPEGYRLTVTGDPADQVRLVDAGSFAPVDEAGVGVADADGISLFLPADPNRTDALVAPTLAGEPAETDEAPGIPGTATDTDETTPVAETESGGFRRDWIAKAGDDLVGVTWFEGETARGGIGLPDGLTVLSAFDAAGEVVGDFAAGREGPLGLYWTCPADAAALPRSDATADLREIAWGPGVEVDATGAIENAKDFAAPPPAAERVVADLVAATGGGNAWRSAEIGRLTSVRIVGQAESRLVVDAFAICAAFAGVVLWLTVSAESDRVVVTRAALCGGFVGLLLATTADAFVALTVGCGIAIGWQVFASRLATSESNDDRPTEGSPSRITVGA